MECPKCGYVMQPFEESCPRCARLGPPQPAAPAAPPDAQPAVSPYVTAPKPSYVEYAGFWRRFAAAMIDGAIVSIAGAIIGGVVGGMIGFYLGSSGSNETEITRSAGVAGNIIGPVLHWLYFTIMESSARAATFGKSALGICVTDLNGDRISFGRANARYWSKIISALILLIGYIMAGFTAKKQALHDMIGGTLVVRG